MKVSAIREALGHAKRFVTHAEWVLRGCEEQSVGDIQIRITDVGGGPGYDVMLDAAHHLKEALKPYRRRKAGGKA